VLEKTAVSVDVCAVALVNEIELGERLHDGVLDAAAGEVVIVQLSVTVPVNELPGVTVMVELPLVVPELMVMAALLERAKLLLLLPLGACQKSPQPARTKTERPANTAAVSTNCCRAEPPMFIAAPSLSYSLVDCS
jgi:hypothetical protein